MAQHAGDLHDSSGLPVKPALKRPAWKWMSPEDVVGLQQNADDYQSFAYVTTKLKVFKWSSIRLGYY